MTPALSVIEVVLFFYTRERGTGKARGPPTHDRVTSGLNVKLSGEFKVQQEFTRSMVGRDICHSDGALRCFIDLPRLLQLG